MKTYAAVYNEGMGFTETRKEYASIGELIAGEGNTVAEGHIYRGSKRIY